MDSALTAVDLSVAISVVSALTALAAVIIGPFVQARITRKQTILPMRKEWIEKLRQLMAEYICLIDSYSAKVTSGRTVSHGEDVKLIEQLSRIQTTIRLMLNPLESEHNAVLSSMEQFVRGIPEKGSNEVSDAFVQKRGVVLTHCQTVLKLEWQRVKKWKL